VFKGEKMTAEALFKTIAMGIQRNSPTILTTLGTAGFVTTVVLAVKATPEAMYLIENDKRRSNEILTRRKIVKIAWKCYIPAAVTGVVSLGCFIGSNSISLRRSAILAGLYSLSETALKEYQENVADILGKNREEKLNEEIVQRKLDKDPASSKEVIITGKGEVLFYDTWSGRYFKSDMEAVRRSQNDLNAELLGGGMYIPLNSLYDELGLEAVESGNQIGWTLDGILDIRFTSKLAEGVPCVVMEYKPRPKEF
jgi:hypothetical protein